MANVLYDKLPFCSSAEMRDFVSIYGVNSLLKRVERRIEELAKRKYSPFLGSLCGILLEDLVNAGLIAVNEHYAEWDSERSNFFTFIDMYVNYRLTDFIRINSRHSRLGIARQKRIENVTAELSVQLGRAPSEAEVAKALGVDEATLNRLYLEINERLVHSGDMRLGAEYFADGGEKSQSLFDAASLAYDAPVLRPENAILLESGFDSAFRILGPAERIAFYGFFCLEITLRQVAMALELSESRLSQSMPSVVAQAFRGLGLKIVDSLYASGGMLNYGLLTREVGKRWNGLTDSARHKLIECYGLNRFSVIPLPPPEPTITAYSFTLPAGLSFVNFGAAMCTDENAISLILRLREAS